MPQLGFRLDLARCVGCRACEVACRQEMNTVHGVRYRQVLERQGGEFPNPRRLFVSIACNHCAEPACMKACPRGAISKDPTWGIVLIDQERCVGCRYCAAVCPYGAPQFNPATGKTEKCTLCVHRVLTKDRKALTGYKPACVATCIGKALEFVTDMGEPAEPDPSNFADRKMTRPAIEFRWGWETPW